MPGTARDQLDAQLVDAADAIVRAYPRSPGAAVSALLEVDASTQDRREALDAARDKLAAAWPVDDVDAYVELVTEQADL